MLPKEESSASLYTEIKRRAGQSVRATVPVAKFDGPSIPVCVSLERENGISAREEFLWRLKETAGRSEEAATKILHSNGWPLAAYLRLVMNLCSRVLHKEVAETIESSVRPFSMPSPDVPAEGQTRIIEVNVPLGDRIFRDRLEWAVGQPHNSPERYAAGVCSELGLDWQDAKVIAEAMQKQIASLPQQQEAAHQGPCMHKCRQPEEASLFARYPRLDLQ